MPDDVRVAHRLPQPTELLLLVAESSLPALPALATLAEVCRVRAGERRRPAPRGRVKVEQIGRCLVEEGSVVAGEEHRARPGSQGLEQERDGGDVQVIGGLVEKQHVGAT
ncbi:MAG: hypothetical protein BWY91_02526 [bacterium ADurb.BinA028]|nr:MAG: hypothetical protein BWY91_02526 [bacterium ADurb.BinA028]